MELSGQNNLAEARLEALRTLRESGNIPEGIRWEASLTGLVMQASPDFDHAAVVRGLRTQIEPHLPADVFVLNDYALLVGHGIERTPDLLVLDTRKRAEHRDGHALSAEGVWLFVEVTSRGTRITDLEEKPREYAQAGVPVMLIVDRREHELIVYSNPSSFGYADTHRGKVGQQVALPKPLDITLDTTFIEQYLD
jgi:Uma2 family endonuclease